MPRADCWHPSPVARFAPDLQDEQLMARPDPGGLRERGEVVFGGAHEAHGLHAAYYTNIRIGVERGRARNERRRRRATPLLGPNPPNAGKSWARDRSVRRDPAVFSVSRQIPPS